MWLGNFTQRLKTNPGHAPNKQTAMDQLLKETAMEPLRELEKQLNKKQTNGKGQPNQHMPP